VAYFRADFMFKLYLGKNEIFIIFQDILHNFCFIFHITPSIYLFILSFSVNYVTGYGLDGPGIESRWEEFFRTCTDRPWGPPSLLYNGYRVFPGGRKRPGRDADPLPPSNAKV
jgi:hypothetical protein